MKYSTCLLLFLVYKNVFIQASNAETEQSPTTSKRKLETVTETCYPGGRCVKVYKPDTPVTWDQAHDACKSKGESFATIENADENSAIVDTGLCDYYWINCRQFGAIDTAWQYKDNDGNLSTYTFHTNWNPGQPEANTEQCAVLHGDNIDLKNIGVNPSHMLNDCEGDCDLDSGCRSGQCFQRDNGGPIPSGCNGTPNIDYDYCIPTPTFWHDWVCSSTLPCYVCIGTNAGGGGDPHFSAFGGITFTWQGHCDTVLAKIPSQNNTKNGVEMHIRTRKIREWSKIDIIAVKVGQDVLEIESNEGNLLLNGGEVKSVEKNSLSVKKSIVNLFKKLNKKIILYEFVFDEDKKLDVTVNTRTEMVYVSLSGNYPEDTIGVLGSPYRPGLFARDGTDMTGKDVNKFVESWQVREDDPQLFLTSRAPQFPEKCLYNMKEIKRKSRSRRLKEKQEISMDEAIAACADHMPGPLKAFCVKDLIATGDYDSAKDKFYG